MRQIFHPPLEQLIDVIAFKEGGGESGDEAIGCLHAIDNYWLEWALQITEVKTYSPSSSIGMYSKFESTFVWVIWTTFQDHLLPTSMSLVLAKVQKYPNSDLFQDHLITTAGFSTVISTKYGAWYMSFIFTMIEGCEISWKYFTSTNLGLFAHNLT